MLKMNPFALTEALQVAHAVTFCTSFEQEVCKAERSFDSTFTLQDVEKIAKKATAFAEAAANAAVEAYANRFNINIDEARVEVPG